MGNDRSDALQLLKPIKDALSEDMIQELERILWKNQNRPPLGKADGSFSETQWTEFRDLVRELSGVSDTLKYGEIYK